MKKFFAACLTMAVGLSLIGCSRSNIEEVTYSDIEAVGDVVDTLALLSYAEYLDAEVDTPVKVETYVQAKHVWEDGYTDVYIQNEDGAIFVYHMKCSKGDYEKLVPGQKIIVTGNKYEWFGETEIVDATFEFAEGNYIAEPVDVTDILETDELYYYLNQRVSFKGMTVEAASDKDKEAAYLYNYDGSGSEGDDLYFVASKNGIPYTFTIETDLCDSDSDVYKAVKKLKVGDVVDMEGFLYWYEGANPHITSVKVNK